MQFSLSNLRLFLLTALALAIVPSAALAQRNLKDIPDPDPELERKTFELAPNLEVQLFAADPLLSKPIQMNFDDRGRLWVASSEVYPQIKPGQQATDKILVLEDTNRDGVIDKTTVFCDGLLIPTGVIPGDGGCYVANSTELVHYKDTDGDGRADQRRVILSGFGTEDTHHLLHTLRWGVDGCLYMNQSIYIHSHVETPFGVKRLNGGGIWRYRPETQELSILAKGLVNSWGHQQDKWGQSFATDGAGGEGINFVFPGSVFVTSPGAKRIVAGLNPGSPKFCGLEFLSGRHFPPEWDGSIITSDFRAHRVCRFVLSEDQSGYASRQEVEVIKSNHVAFRPIDAKMGPDGALYVADWYNPIIQHGEVDFRDERRDHVHGRIWRVSYKGREPLPIYDFENATAQQVLDALKSPEEFTRQYAKLRLKTRPDAVALLPKWVAELPADDAEREHHRLEALWAYQSVGKFEGKLLDELLRSADPRVRAAAIRVAVDWQSNFKNAQQIFANAAVDSHPRVRLEGVRALATLPTVAAAAAAVKALDQPVDRFLDFAIWQTMRDLAPQWLPAVQEGKFDFDGNVEHLTFALKSADSGDVAGPLLAVVNAGKVPAERLEQVLSIVCSLGGPNELAQVLSRITAAEGLTVDQKSRLLAELVKASQVRKVQPAGDLNVVAALLASDTPALRQAAVDAAGSWKLASLAPSVSEIAASSALPLELRASAMKSMVAIGAAGAKEQLAALAAKDPELATRQQAIAALATADRVLASNLLVQLLASEAAAVDPAVAVTPILAQQDGAVALQKSLESKKIPADSAKLLVRSAQAAAQPSEELISAIRTAGSLESSGWMLDDALLASLVADVKSMGDPARGEAIYRAERMQCLKCHPIGGAGGQVGPDLVSIGASAQVDYLVESLLAPSKKIKEGFHSKVVLDDEGKLTTGIPIRDTESEIILRDADDKLVTISKDNIEQMKDGISLMPMGLVDSLTRQELVDLVRFLSELGKVGDYAIGQSRAVRRWQVLEYSDDTHRILNRSSFDSAAIEDPAFNWTSRYSKVSGELPLEGLPTLQPHKQLAPTTFARFQLDVSTAGKLQLNWNATAGLQLWVDGKPQPVSEKLVLDLAVGRHTLVVAIDRNSHPQPIRVELSDVAGSAAQSQLVGGK